MENGIWLSLVTTCDGRVLEKPAVSMEMLGEWGTFAICQFLQGDKKRKMLEQWTEKAADIRCPLDDLDVA